MDNSPLGNYIAHVHSSGAFDLIVETQKAIQEGDNSTALMRLGELRGLIWIMHHLIESLNKADRTTSTS